MPCAWFARKVRQVWLGGRPEVRLRYRRIERALATMPSFMSSPRIRCVPQVGFSAAICAIRSLTSGARRGRPTRLLDLQVQYRLHPLRCQLITVSGLTTKRYRFHETGKTLRMDTQRNRSRLLRRGLGWGRRAICSWWRRARFSRISSASGRRRERTRQRTNLKSSIIAGG